MYTTRTAYFLCVLWQHIASASYESGKVPDEVVPSCTEMRRIFHAIDAGDITYHQTPETCIPCIARELAMYILSTQAAIASELTDALYASELTDALYATKNMLDKRD